MGLEALRDDFFHDVVRRHETEDGIGLLYQEAGRVLPLKEQRRLADGNIAWNLHDPRCHHMGYHSWYDIEGLGGLFV